MTKEIAPQDRGANRVISAAKIHVLNLEPIKIRLGKKWPRLSGLAHSLFEKALKRGQGPLDGFVGAGELTYIATFHGRSPDQVTLLCASIAREVCELLFGDGAGDISVRNLVGAVGADEAHLPINQETLADTLQ